MCVIVLFPPFPRRERECGVALGSQREPIEASVTAATQSPGTEQIPGSALVGGGAGTGPGSSRSPTGLFFQLLSPAQGELESRWEFA